jgi:uncharacterized protein YkwD/uncharacterized membrane protein required for colicin V production
MNWVDLLIIIFLFGCVWHGLRLGFIGSLFNVVVSIGSLVLSFWSYAPVAQFIRERTEIAEYLVPIASFFLLFLFLRVVVGYLMYFVWSGIDIFLRALAPVMLLDRVLGGVLHVGLGVVMVVLVAIVLLRVQFWPSLTSSVGASMIVRNLVPKSGNVELWIRGLVDKFPAETLVYLTPRQPQSNEVIRMSFPSNVDLKVSEVDEREMLDLLNEERKKVQLRELLWDESLAVVAREHSKDMFRRQYFGHTNPDGWTAGERLSHANVEYLISGENLAYAPNVELAHRGLMNSPGHRDNILRREFSRVGIGVQDGGLYGKMYTQNFAD